MDGPCAKVNFVLSEEPRVTGMPRGMARIAALAFHAGAFARIRRTLLRHREVRRNSRRAVGRLRGRLQRRFHARAAGQARDDHVHSVRPLHLRHGTWDENRELLGDRVVKKIAEYAPNVPNSIIARQVLTPLDLERTYGLTEGNIFHGDLSLEQLFFMRPVAGWAQYRTPIAGLYLCGAGAHPGGGVTGAPGYNAAHQVLRDSRAETVARVK